MSLTICLYVFNLEKVFNRVQSQVGEKYVRKRKWFSLEEAQKMLYAFKPIQAKYLVALKQSKSNLNSLETLQQQSSDHDNSSQIQNLEGKNARS